MRLTYEEPHGHPDYGVGLHDKFLDISFHFTVCNAGCQEL